MGFVELFEDSKGFAELFKDSKGFVELFEDSKGFVELLEDSKGLGFRVAVQGLECKEHSPITGLWELWRWMLGLLGGSSCKCGYK